MRGLWLAALALAQLATAESVVRDLSIHSPRFTIFTEGSHEPKRAGPLSLGRPVSPPLNLTAQDTLKLTFSVFARNPGDVADNAKPHQTFLRFYDPVTEEEGIQPVRVKADGKAKFDLNMAKPPIALPATPTGGPLQVWLVLGSFKYQSAAYRLFELYLPRTQPAPQHPDEPSFHPLPAIHHTFRPDPKLPPRIISLVFAGAVLAPWAILLALLARIPHPLPRLASPKIAPFVALLAAFEALLFTYWLRLKLPDVLLYGAILAIPTVAAGKRALSATVQWRLGEKA
ncbi:hypothetical protein AURDEDRAFT_111834 [Auricularia subglabra TFB-10046 SS5]|nr:hypothetical protein AURDEDRAFT_111834 [Auricularia subglabra TFB-10046 SS5]